LPKLPILKLFCLLVFLQVRNPKISPIIKLIILAQLPKSQQLKINKLKNLQASSPEMIVTANIGCLMHLQKGTKIPVKHWIELLGN
jgi:Fe-S oxidoreductase